MRTIRVTGRGQIKVHPDTTRITMTMEGVYPEYADALRHSAGDTEKLKDVLSAFGFDRQDLKTLNFNINAEYNSWRDKNGDYRQKFAGYKFSHVLKVEFESDSDRLGRILYALAHGGVKPEIRISYTVGDPEAVKNTLLGKAVADAWEKAAVLSRAAGITLGDVQTIDYSWGEISLEVNPTGKLLMEESMPVPMACSYDMDIQPDDVDVSDTITVIWEIA